MNMAEMNRFTKAELEKISIREIMGEKAYFYYSTIEDFILEDAYVLRQGVCDSFALALHDEFGYEGWYIEEPCHYFCSTVRNGKKYYIDAMGVCNDLNTLLDKPGVTEDDLLPQDFEKTREFKEHLGREGYEFSKEFIKKYRRYYQI